MRSVGLTLVPGEVMDHILLESISKHVNCKKAIRSTQHNFTKGESSLTKYGEMTASVGEECGGCSDSLMSTCSLL